METIPTRKIRTRESAFARLFSSSISGSLLLIFATLLALIFANSDLAEFYHYICNQTISLHIGQHDILASHEGTMTVSKFVNDALMAIFFFVVGLEIKRELLIGELSNVRQAMLPLIAAVGGMIVPVIIFYLIAGGTPAEGGLAIPMATDIAFSLGVLSLLGNRVPVGLKVFLTALAVADDLGSILVIALFYTKHIAYVYLFISVAIMIILYLGGRRGVNNIAFYSSLGVLMWFMFYHAGIHPTIAGVLVAFFIPARPSINTNQFLAKIRNNLLRFDPSYVAHKGVVLLSHSQTDVLTRLSVAANRVISPLQKMEDFLHPAVTFFIIPVFAFVNAGVSLGGGSLHELVSEASLGVGAGLLFGKFIGIFFFSLLAIKIGIVGLPSGVNFKQLAAVSVIGGIGFTVSLFISHLSYEHIPEVGRTLLNEAKFGILAASLLAGVVGYQALRFTLPRR